MELLAPELVEAFRSCRTAVQSSEAAAAQWVRRIHFAFYSAKSTRGSNKFLALESTLTDVFTHLNSDGDSSQFFWELVVQVLLTLAQEPIVGLPTGNSPKSPQPPSTDQKRSKKCQPNAPLAFLVVNALRKIASGDANNEQAELCRLQGRNNEQLRNFCTKGLGNVSDVDQKLLVELLRLFQITDIDAGFVWSAMDYLLASKSHAALIKLCETFSDVAWPFETVVMRMVQTKDWTSAELLVRTFERDGDTALAKVLIDETINLREFKRAHRFVSNLNLQTQYPDIDVLYSRDGLMRLMGTQRWQLALTFVGHDTTLQKVLLEHMVAARELVHAAQLVKNMVAAGFEPDISLMTPNLPNSAEVGATWGSGQSGIEDDSFLSLSEEDHNVMFCDSEDAVREAMVHLFEPSAYRKGVDAKSRCQSSGGLGRGMEAHHITIESNESSGEHPADSAVGPSFIIDLLALHDNDFFFDSFLLRLLSSPQWLKLGFSFDSDLKVLHQTFPERQAFATVSPFLDLNLLKLKSGSLVGTGLSHCIRHVLGKPMDKRMQLGDWEQRPLSQGQLTYAALDALCLVQVVKKLQDRSDNDNGWREVSKRIGKLDLARSLNEDEVLEATSHRIEYQKKWLLQSARGDDTECATSVVTPQEILRTWEDRTSSIAPEQNVDFDTTLKFLPMDQITAMLEGEGADPHDFIAVNSICTFVDETPSVVCIDASCKLDMAQFARFRGVGRRSVRLATASECRSAFGFTPGIVAPFGHKTWTSASDENSAQPAQIKVYADSRLQRAQYLAAGSGSPDEAIWVESRALLALIGINLVARSRFRVIPRALFLRPHSL
ncbi:hypothetical protein PHYPSEUDO_010384 [Phytophthora pseudosyringae]|uniref:3'-5' exonuclease domain-containing protein n=1 Tax=Phytophthora pseudosyringae TaxID=221518 RepID=A0A8T1VDA4_9STRA|nr:hypothetical protein PHYPSEUDO_010384 [Phytophthora pseudosyringae]